MSLLGGAVGHPNVMCDIKILSEQHSHVHRHSQWGNIERHKQHKHCNRCLKTKKEQKVQLSIIIQEWNWQPRGKRCLCFYKNSLKETEIERQRDHDPNFVDEKWEAQKWRKAVRGQGGECVPVGEKQDSNPVPVCNEHTQRIHSSSCLDPLFHLHLKIVIGFPQIHQIRKWSLRGVDGPHQVQQLNNETGRTPRSFQCLLCETCLYSGIGPWCATEAPQCHHLGVSTKSS